MLTQQRAASHRITSLLMAGLVFAGCSASGDGIPGLRVADVRPAFEALGAHCDEEQAGIDNTWEIVCQMPQPAGCQGKACATNIADAGGSETAISSLDARALAADPNAAAWLDALAAVPYMGSDRSAASAFVAAHLVSPACTSGLGDDGPWATDIGDGTFVLTCSGGQLELGLYRLGKAPPASGRG
jgi:hypothetical protein